MGEDCALIISPSPNELSKHITIDLEIKGIDVSQINPNTFDFVFIGDNNELLETSKSQLKIDVNKHKIKVKGANIYPNPPPCIPPGQRYSFIR